VPVGDGGAAEGPLSACLHCFNNEGRFQWWQNGFLFPGSSCLLAAFWRGLAFEVVSDGIRAPGIHGWPVDVRFPATRTQDAATHVGSKGDGRAPAVGQ
jgi:hypothetical protein